MNTFLPLALGLALAGCAHSYSYQPEVSGEGTMQGKNGVIYAVPSAAAPAFKLKVASLGIHRVKQAGVNSPLMQLRMYFLRQGDTCLPISMHPRELLVKFTDGAGIRPVSIHANAQNKPKIQLTCAKRQAVDLYFPVPPSFKGPKDIQDFTFQWEVAYGAQRETQLTRFDRKDSAPQQGSELFPEDPYYPYDESPLFPPGWFDDSSIWWAPMPM